MTLKINIYLISILLVCFISCIFVDHFKNTQIDYGDKTPPIFKGITSIEKFGNDSFIIVRWSKAIDYDNNGQISVRPIGYFAFLSNDSSLLVNDTNRYRYDSCIAAIAQDTFAVIAKPSYDTIYCIVKAGDRGTIPFSDSTILCNLDTNKVVKRLIW